MRTIFDTGAGFSVLNSARRAELGLQAENTYSQEVSDPTGARIVMEVFWHSRFGVKDISLGECEFFAIDLAAVEMGLGTQVDFVLGVNTMLRSGCVWVVDSNTGSIWLANTGVEVTNAHESAG